MSEILAYIETLNARESEADHIERQAELHEMERDAVALGEDAQLRATGCWSD